jgi:hypothetical protein
MAFTNLPFTPVDATCGTYCVEVWVDLIADLEVVEKRKISCPYQETNHPARSLVAIPTELSRLMYQLD